jgi:two-component system, NarL family, sensor histidine kinase DegS
VTAAAATLDPMDSTRGEQGTSRFDELHAEAAQGLSYSANALRAIRDRYRQAYLDELGRWHVLRDDLASLERTPIGLVATGPDASDGSGPGASGDDDRAADAAERGAADLRLRLLRGDVEHLAQDLGRHQAELSRLELAIRNLESSWLFLERGDATLVTDVSTPTLTTEIQMRIVEAQEAERARLAQEVHDGPAQALSNAIFQVEYIERVFDTDTRMARTELRFLRELLRRELGDVRSFIGQLRPPVLVELGLDGSIADTADTMRALSGLRILTDLTAPGAALIEAEQTVVLRIVQEALQNVRKHAGATSVVIATRLDEDEWLLEVRDDGRGFDVGTVAARGRRNFGLQFMRERAELIGARFEVHSRPDAGTVVRLGIPVSRKEKG